MHYKSSNVIFSLLVELITKEFGCRHLAINICTFGILLLIDCLLLHKYGCAKNVTVKGMFAVIVAMLLAVFGCFCLCRNTVLRYAVIAFAVVGVYYRYRSQLIRLMKTKLKKKTNKKVEE